MKSYTFGVAGLVLLGAGSVAFGQGAGSAGPTGSDARRWLAGLEDPETVVASSASEWLWQTEGFSEGQGASEFDWGSGALIGESFAYGTWTDDQESVQGWAPAWYQQWNRGLEIAFLDLADPSLFVRFRIGGPILVPETVITGAAVAVAPRVIVHAPVLVHEPLIVTKSTIIAPTFFGAGFVHGGAYVFDDVRFRRGFRGGFHRGFHRGFHGGYHRGFHGGFHRGFHGGFHRGFVGPKVFIGPRIFIGPKFKHGFRRIGHAPGVSLSYSADGFFFGFNTFGHHAPRGRVSLYSNAFHAAAHARSSSIAFGHAKVWPWHQPLGGHEKHGRVTHGHVNHGHSGGHHVGSARVDRSVSVNVTDSPGAVVNVGRGSAGRSSAAVRVMEGDQRGRGDLASASQGALRREVARSRQQAASVASVGSLGRESFAASPRVARVPTPSVRVPTQEVARVGRDRSAGIPVSVERASRRVAPTAQPSRGRQGEPTPVRVARPERPQVSGGAAGGTRGAAPVARPVRPEAAPRGAGPAVDRQRPEGRGRPDARPEPTPRPRPNAGPTAGPTTGGPSARPKAAPSPDVAPARSPGRRAEAAPAAEAGGAAAGGAGPVSEAPSGDQA